MRSFLPCCISAGESVLGENMPGRFVGCLVCAKSRAFDRRKKKKKKVDQDEMPNCALKKSRDERM